MSLCALAAAVAFLRIPESPRWLVSRDAAAAEAACRRFEAARRLRGVPAAPPAPRIAVEPQTSRPWVFVGSLYFLHPWAVSAFPLLTGPVLLAQGMQLTDTLLYVTAASLGPVLGTGCAGLLVDRLDRRVTLIACAAAMLLSLTLFFVSHSAPLMLCAVTAFGVGVALYTPAMTLYGAELFTAGERAPATALAWGGNRAASALVPMLLLPLLQAHGPLLLGMAAGTALAASAVLIAARGPAGAAGLSVR